MAGGKEELSVVVCKGGFSTHTINKIYLRLSLIVEKCRNISGSRGVILFSYHSMPCCASEDYRMDPGGHS
jgi:hypothetical protein